MDGRIILLEYETLLLLHTYSPNNGVDGPHFAKRAAWEERIRTFSRDIKEWRRKPLVYVGDLNGAPRDEDLSHPSWFKRENNVNKRRLGRPPAGGWVTERLDPDDEGQPGCSERECRMFRELLSEGALFDAFRAKKNPSPDTRLLEAWRPDWSEEIGRRMPLDRGFYAYAAELAEARLKG